MSKPNFTFTLPADQAERLKKLFRDYADEGKRGNYRGHRVPAGHLDMSSNEPHVTNECPFCDHVWMDLVKPEGKCPCCHRAYTMEKLESGQISIGWSISIEEAATLKNRDNL